MADTSDNSAQRPRARANNVSDNKGGDCCSIRRLALSQLLAGTVLVVVFVNFLLWAHNQQPGGDIDNPGSRTASNSGGGRLRSDKFSSSQTAGAHRRLGGGARVTLPLPPMILSPPSPPPPPPAYLLETGAVPFTAVPAFSGREAAFIAEEGTSSVCVAWRATELQTCDPAGYRAPMNDSACAVAVRGPGYCEVLDLERDAQTNDEASVYGAKRRVMRRGCRSWPEEIRCADAPEFDAFSAASLAYRESELPGAVDAKRGPSRGIVIAIADGLIVSAYAVVRLLRSQGCTLPIDLWAFPHELTEASLPALHDMMQNYGVTLQKILASKDDLCLDHSRCFGIKPYAVFHTRFESVLLLDSDNFPIRDPTYLFDTAEFQDTGAIFWPDFWYPQRTMFHVDRDSMLWELTGIKYVDMFEQESGQLLVNRTMHERALHIMMYYSKPSNLIWRWNLVWGDKDLYRLAWMRAGEAFHMIRTPAGSAGQVSGPYFCGQTMVQHDPQGRPVFFHRNTYKLGPGSTHRVWDAYLRFVGDDPLQQYSVDVWSGPSHRLRFLSKVCFGQREPATAKHWALQPIAEMTEVAELEWKMISFVEELGGEGNQ